MRRFVFDRTREVSIWDGIRRVGRLPDTIETRVPTELMSHQCMMQLIGAAISDNAVSTRQASHQCEIQSILREDIDV